MFKKLTITFLFIIACAQTGIAQELHEQVETINGFIEEHSEGNRNYYAKINATQGNIYFYNGPQHVIELTFDVTKIDAENIKVGKKGLTFFPNEKGYLVKKRFSTTNSTVGSAWLNVIKMSKNDKAELKNMMKKFILDYQKAMK